MLKLGVIKINTNIHIHIHLCEIVDNTHFQSEKQSDTIYLKQRSIIFGKSSYESSLIFIKSFLYLIDYHYLFP